MLRDSRVPGMMRWPKSQVIWGTMVRHYRSEGQRQQGQDIIRNRVSEGKYEAEPVHVAYSEPAVWCWGRGRADVTMSPDIRR
jgi:hypothetical protein